MLAFSRSNPIYTLVLMVLLTLGIGVSIRHFFNTDPHNLAYLSHPVMIQFHVISGGLYFLLVFPQLSSSIRRLAPVLHRTAGKVAIVFGMLSGIGALIVSIAIPYSGVIESLVTGPFAVYFLFALYKSFAAARASRYKAHAKWALRALALGLSIVTQRLIFVPALLALGHPEQNAVWLSVVSFLAAFIINCSIAEWWIAKQR